MCNISPLTLRHIPHYSDYCVFPNILEYCVSAMGTDISTILRKNILDNILRTRWRLYKQMYVPQNNLILNIFIISTVVLFFYN